jgi:hypothetical protein
MREHSSGDFGLLHEKLCRLCCSSGDFGLLHEKFCASQAAQFHLVLHGLEHAGFNHAITQRAAAAKRSAVEMVTEA